MAGWDHHRSGGVLVGRDGDDQNQNLSPADQFLKLIQNPFKTEVSIATPLLSFSASCRVRNNHRCPNLRLTSALRRGQFQVNAFWASLATSVGLSLFLTFLFSVFRPHHTVVYAPKLKHADQKHAPPPVGRGIFSWIKPVVNTQEEDLVDRIGLDATLFLRFARMCRNMFLALSVIGCAVLIPINISQSSGAVAQGFSAFSTMTPLYVTTEAIWSQVICAWAFDAIVIFFLWQNYRALLRLRRRYFQTPDYQMSLHARTLMVGLRSSQYFDPCGIVC